MGTNSYGYVYDPIGDQKSAKPKAEPQGDRDFEAVRQRGARSGIPRRSGNCNRLTAAANIATNVYASNPLNQYTNIAGGSVYSPAYDADGNMLTNGVWAFVWDGENRLVSACSNGVLLVSNAYDHRSRRIRKEVSVWDPQLAAYRSQSTASFLWDNWNIIRETVAIGNTQSAVTNYYTWGVDLSGSLQGAGGVGGLLSVTTTDTNSGTSTNYYPCYDANGNVTAYLDAGGSAVARYEYDAFGNAVNESVQEGRHLPFRFSTKYMDAETGLYCYGYRFYWPELGRWMSRGPIEEEGGENLYAMVENRSTDDVDIHGCRGLSSKTRRKLKKLPGKVSTVLGDALDLGLEVLAHFRSKERAIEKGYEMCRSQKPQHTIPTSSKPILTAAPCNCCVIGIRSINLNDSTIYFLAYATVHGNNCDETKKIGSLRPDDVREEYVPW